MIQKLYNQKINIKLTSIKIKHFTIGEVIVIC